MTWTPTGATLVGPQGPAGADGSDADVTTHEGASDPHPQYLTQTEGDARYPLSSAVAELIRDTIGTALVQGASIGITVNDAGDTITIAVVPQPVYAAPRSLGNATGAVNTDCSVAGDAVYTLTGDATFTPTGTNDGRMVLIKGKASGAQRIMSLPTSVKLATTGGPTSRSLTVPTGDMGQFAISYDALAAAWLLHSAQVFDL